MAMYPIHSSVGISFGDFLKNPKKILAAAAPQTIAVFEADQPIFYITPIAGPTHINANLVTPSSTPSFTAVANRLIQMETERSERGEISKDSLNILRNRLHLHILPFFDPIAPADTCEEHIDAFLNRLGSHALSSVTISQYVVVLRKLLKQAKRMGLLDELPDIPVVKIRQKPRSTLTLREYQQVVRTANQLSRNRVSAVTSDVGLALVKDWVYPRDLTLPSEMAWLVRFMVNSFVRPGDIRQLRHRHVHVVRGEKTYLRLQLPETKSHSEPVVTLIPAVRVYEKILGHARKKGYGRPDDFVFMPHEHNRCYALTVMGFWFKWLLGEARVATQDAFHRSRTLYCLRHTSIMFRLLYGQGIDVLTLAKNARTSVQMIEKFYASSLSAEMNIDLLQSRRTRTP
jgi:integrase